jgi:hypothetical protein
MKQLHVQLIVLDDQNGFGHRLRLGRFDQRMMVDLATIRHGAEKGPIPLVGHGFHRKSPNQLLRDWPKMRGNRRFF